jgi:hypothetical protein
MARGGHGLPKGFARPAMPYPSTPCGWLARRADGLQPSSTPLDNPPPYAYGRDHILVLSIPSVTIASLRDDLKASEKSNHDLKFELEQKGNEIGRLGEEIGEFQGQADKVENHITNQQ